MTHKKKEVVLTGATGSIGKSCLEVIRHNPGIFRVSALTGFTNLDLLEALCREFKPAAVCVGEGDKQHFCKRFGNAGKKPEILEGIGGLNKTVFDYGDMVVAGISGSAGIYPVYTAAACGKTIVLANKESLVIAGKLIMKTAKKNRAKILPMDSEHNAIYQALGNNSVEDIDHIILTSSGGPFLNTPKEAFCNVSVEHALKHPNWSMGRKITIDSATMMNKSLEIIEAAHLFRLPPSKIKVVIHPQVIVHSAVQLKDGSILAQLGSTDMKIPAAFCLGDGERIISNAKKLDLTELSGLHFYPPDVDKYPTIGFAYQILKMKDSAGGVFNGANEILVDEFLNENIRFVDIFTILGELVEHLETRQKQALQDDTLLFDIDTLDDAIRANLAGMAFSKNAIKRYKAS